MLAYIVDLCKNGDLKVSIMDGFFPQQASPRSKNNKSEKKFDFFTFT